VLKFKAGDKVRHAFTDKHGVGTVLKVNPKDPCGQPYLVEWANGQWCLHAEKNLLPH
jgi:hypothetical protein